jgi:hypothetical protein
MLETLKNLIVTKIMFTSVIRSTYLFSRFVPRIDSEDAKYKHSLASDDMYYN